VRQGKVARQAGRREAARFHFHATADSVVDSRVHRRIGCGTASPPQIRFHFCTTLGSAIRARGLGANEKRSRLPAAPLSDPLPGPAPRVGGDGPDEIFSLVAGERYPVSGNRAIRKTRAGERGYASIEFQTN
jgi:hypothetical protein